MLLLLSLLFRLFLLIPVANLHYFLLCFVLFVLFCIKNMYLVLQSVYPLKLIKIQHDQNIFGCYYLYFLWPIFPPLPIVSVPVYLQMIELDVERNKRASPSILPDPFDESVDAFHFEFVLCTVECKLMLTENVFRLKQ